MANLSNINNKFLVTTGGKVGIGITAPTGILHTDQTFSGYAPVTFKNSVTNQGQFVELITSTDEGSKYTGIESISLQTGNGWKVWGGGNNFGEMYLSVSGSNAIVIKNDLKVGIGTNSPNYKLHVSDTSIDTLLRVENSSTNKYPHISIKASAKEYHIGVGGASAVTGYANNLYFYDNTTAAIRMLIDTNGKVGIGTSSPNKALTVYGGNDNGIWIDSQGAQYTSLAFGHNGTEKANIAWDNTNGYTNITTYASGHLAMSTGGSINAFLNSSGNFGIGTTAPSYKLHVVGNMNIQGAGGYLRWNSGDMAIVNAGSYAMAFQTYNGSALTEKMRIDSSGNVSIISGKLSIGQSSENNIAYTTGETWIGSNGLRYNSGSDTFARTSASSQAAMMVLTTTADVEFYAQPSTSQTGTYALSPKMVIQGATGNVGIGGGNINSPASVGTFLNITGRNGVGAGTAGIVLKDYDNAAWDIWNSGGVLNFRYNNGAGGAGDGVSISTTGTVNITSSTPDAAIFDTASASYGAMNTFRAQGVTKGASGYNAGSMYFGGEAGTNTIIQAGGQTGIYVNNISRNIGLKMTTPVATLEIGGSIGSAAYNQSNNGIKNQRMQVNWYTGQQFNNSTAYTHIKTSLLMGDAGNTQYIMGGFTARSYGYGSSGTGGGYGEGSCMFHNWNGTFHSLSVTNRGDWTGFMQSPYKSSDGYCVIVLRHNYYSTPQIDFFQEYSGYAWRAVSVTAQGTSSSNTGLY